VTVEEAIERLVELERSRERSADYVRRYKQAVRSLQGFLGGKDLRGVTEEDVVAFLHHLEESGYCKTTVNNLFFQLRRVYRHLVQEGLVLNDPTLFLERRNVPSRMRDWLSEEEAKLLLEQPPAATVLGLRDRAILEVLYATGVRMGELRALELDDLDLGEGLVTVKASKNGCFRRVPLGKVAGEWVARYLKEARPRLAARRDLGEMPPVAVFLNQTGHRMAKSAIEGVVHHWAGKTGIAKAVTPHVLRHSFAIHLLKNGVSTRHIQEMLGHKHLSSTQIYTRVLPQDLKRVHRRCHPSERSRRRK
jgi:site-specific recombinase XerD